MSRIRTRRLEAALSITEVDAEEPFDERVVDPRGDAALERSVDHGVRMQSRTYRKVVAITGDSVDQVEEVREGRREIDVHETDDAGVARGPRLLDRSALTTTRRRQVRHLPGIASFEHARDLGRVVGGAVVADDDAPAVREVRAGEEITQDRDVPGDILFFVVYRDDDVYRERGCHLTART
jgi:hypothetical protein